MVSDYLQPSAAVVRYLRSRTTTPLPLFVRTLCVIKYSTRRHVSKQCAPESSTFPHLPKDLGLVVVHFPAKTRRPHAVAVCVVQPPHVAFLATSGSSTSLSPRSLGSSVDLVPEATPARAQAQYQRQSRVRVDPTERIWDAATSACGAAAIGELRLTLFPRFRSFPNRLLSQ